MSDERRHYAVVWSFSGLPTVESTRVVGVSAKQARVEPAECTRYRSRLETAELVESSALALELAGRQLDDAILNSEKLVQGLREKRAQVQALALANLRAALAAEVVVNLPPPSSRP